MDGWGGAEYLDGHGGVKNPHQNILLEKKIEK